MRKKITILFLLLITQLFGQAPQKMSYQAVLRNTSNALITNTTVGMRISILQGSITGTAVYVETQNPTTNANGLVSLEIGGGTPVTGTFSGINWANGPFFIKTETAPSGGTNYTITGTTQLLSVPYALYAENSKQQGKTTIILANDITDAQAAAQIAKELGPNTENIIIQNTTQLTTVDFSAALSLISISISNNAALTNVNFNSLTILYGNLDVDSNSNLLSLSMNNITECGNLVIGNNPNLNLISFSNLIKDYGFLSLSNTNLQLISFPNLTSCYNLEISYNSNLNTISTPNISSINNDLIIENNTSLTTISFTNLISVGLGDFAGGISIANNSNLNSISFPSLNFAQGITINTNASLNNISFPNLSNIANQQTGGSFSIAYNPNLSSISLPSLSTINAININNNSILSSISLPALTNTTNFNLCSNKLPSSVVNSILHKLLTVNPSSGKTIGLLQNPPAPPTGQGVIDKTTLMNTGNIVTTD